MLIQPRGYIIKNLENRLIRFTFQDGMVGIFVKPQCLVGCLRFFIEIFTHGRVSDQIRITMQNDYGQGNLDGKIEADLKITEW
jgi:hypothetical protein